MNKILTVFFIWISLFSFSQEKIVITVLDKNNKQPLPFCNVWIKGTNNGTITNEEGKAVLKVSSKSVIVVSFLGYQQKEISYANLLQNKRLYLTPDVQKLNEVIISPDYDYLYDIILECREKLLRNKKKSVSKAYYNIETKANDTVLEFLECYYNAYFDGNQLSNLKYKHGRFGLATVENNYFITMNTSKAIASIDILRNRNSFQFIPTQLEKRKLKKYFNLLLVSATDTYYKIDFSSDRIDCFSGSMYIDIKSKNLLKLTLNSKNTNIHPFTTLYGEVAENKDYISKLNLDLTFKFNIVDDDSQLDIIHFKYDFTYHSDRTTIDSTAKITRNINSNCLLYCYNYQDTFILPYFNINYYGGYYDYFCISTIPYNEVFWQYQDDKVLLSKEKENGLDFLVKNGSLINYKKLNNKDMKLLNVDSSKEAINEKFFTGEYLFWNKNNRVIVTNQQFQTHYQNGDFYRNSLNFKEQILLDITDCRDSLHCKSYTVYDTYETFYYYDEDSLSNAIINIYFDICEIERRKMQKEIDANNFNIEQINRIYQKTLEKIKTTTTLFLEECDEDLRRKNPVRIKSVFEIWNNYIIDNLGIDNKSMSIESWKTKQAKL